MTILRRHHNSNFTIVPNAIFEDKRISVEAKGTLGYLLSRPPDWAVHLAQIGRTLRMGRDKTERVFQELKGAGYVVRGRQKRMGGRWGPAEFLVLDDPRSASALDAEPAAIAALAPQLAGAAPCPEKPLTVESSAVQPHADFQGTYKGFRTNKTDSNKIGDDNLRTRELTLIANDLSTSSIAEPLISPEATALADEIATMLGYELNKVPPQWCGAAMHVAKWLREGWTREVILTGVRSCLAKKRDGPPFSIRYFEQEIARGVAGLKSPLPVATIDGGPNGQDRDGSERGSAPNGKPRTFAGYAMQLAKSAGGT